MESVPGNRDFGAGHRYQRHQPESTSLYPIVEQHLPSLRDELQQHDITLPRFVLTEFQDYLRCGRLEYGFVRVKCNGAVTSTSSLSPANAVASVPPAARGG